MGEFISCSYAHPGTYGHECGSPAVKVGIAQADSTRNGIYYARRCAICATHKGGENSGITQWLDYNKDEHVNQWK